VIDEEVPYGNQGGERTVVMDKAAERRVEGIEHEAE